MTRIDTLPHEIRGQIANELSQFDCIRLMYCNRALYESSYKRLYQYIIIDPNFSQFTKEYSYQFVEHSEFGNFPQAFGASYIKSAYNFKKFLQITSDNIELLKWVKILKCIRLPDSINTFDHELNECFDTCFRNLTTLRELIWLNDYFQIENLSSLPNKHYVTKLILNVKYSSHLDEFSSLNFPNLREFQLTPFENSFKLSKIIDKILIPTENPKKLEMSLTKLKISKFYKETTSVIPSGLLVTDTNDTSVVIPEVDINISNSLFNGRFFVNNLYLKNLSTLSLNHCLVTPSEAKIFIKSVDLRTISTLELKNITEYRRITGLHQAALNMAPILRPEDFYPIIKSSFIIEIAPYLTNLSKLHIDFREGLIDSVPRFIESLPLSCKLKELDVLIRYNWTKKMRYPIWDDLSQTYINAIISHRSSLEKLSLDMKEENPFCDLNKPIIPFQIRKLACLQNLKALRLNGENLQTLLPELVSKFPDLKFLEVFGRNAGGAPHMALEVVHSGVFDEWIKVQHVALTFANKNPRLKYIKIDKCVFEISKEVDVIPRDNIDLWFRERVRVGFDVYNL